MKNFLRAFAFLIFGSFAAAQSTVERWGVFELTLIGPSDGNPFAGVSFSATFTQGDAQHDIPGFYDGDGVYRVRFMPETTGEWRYTTHSNRPALDAKSGAFTATTPSPNNHGPVRVAHTFHFAYADGSPYWQLGTTCYNWAHRSDAQEEQTLRTLATAPFNKLRMCVLPTDRDVAAQRFVPFEGKVLAWDTTRPHPDFFRHLEQRVAQLRDLGVEADLILFQPYGPHWGWTKLEPASEERYLRYLIARLGAFRNVWWSLSNEWDFNHDKTEADWDRLFQVVQAADPYAHLRSIHNGAMLYNATLPWVTHASIQNGAAVLDPERAMLYRDVYRKPIVFDEVKYEGDISARWGNLTGEELVLRFWNGLIAGTYVGHGETFTGPPEAWTAGGGVLRGQSVARLAFLKKIMGELPADGIDPIDKWQDKRTAGKLGEFYLLYFGKDAPASWPFALYKDGVRDGVTFQVEILDTWGMTVTPVAGTFVAKKRDAYTYEDAEKKSVALPGRPYLALRIRRTGGPAVTASQTPPEPP